MADKVAGRAKHQVRQAAPSWPTYSAAPRPAARADRCRRHCPTCRHLNLLRSAVIQKLTAFRSSIVYVCMHGPLWWAYAVFQCST